MTALPKMCDIDFPNQCMLKCRICNYWKNNIPGIGEEGLKPKDYRAFLTDLKELAAQKIKISFGGGEPLMHYKTLFEITKVCKELSFESGFPTNAYLIDEEMAKRIGDSGVDFIGISLDSLKAQTHDYIRGTPGCWDRAMRAIDYLRRHAPHVAVNILTVIMGLNLEEIMELTNWVTEDPYFEGIVFQVIQKPFDVDCPDDWYELDEYKELWIKDFALSDSVLDQLIEKKKSEKYSKDGRSRIATAPWHLEKFKTYFRYPGGFEASGKCHMGNGLVRLGWNGDIYFCGTIGVVGNIKQESIKNIWFSERADQIRREILDCRKSCHNHINCFQEV